MRTPPKYPLRFLRWFCREDYLEEIEGDLTEVYMKQSENSPRKAKWKFAWSAIRYFRPEFIKSFKRKNQILYQAMFRHNFLIAYRNFNRFKSSFIINLVGLSTGLACTFLIYLWVADELSVDKFNQHDDRLFRAMEHRVRATGIWTSPTTPGPMAEALQADMPEIEYAITASWPQPYTLMYNENNISATGRFVGKEFFKMFSYELIAGDADQVLADKNSIVISDQLALKLFQTTDNVVGKSIDFQHTSQVMVSGVFKSMPVNATDQFEFVGSFEKYKDGQDWLQYWGNTGVQTLVLLKPGIEIADFNKKIADFVKVKTNNEITHRTLFLKNYSENYLFGNYDENGIQAGGRITYVKLFSIIAIFILLIACINFMNLSTARASRRVKEVGIKKAVGAGRSALIFQYISESMLMSFLSLFVAMGLVYISLAPFNTITGKHLTFDLDTNTILLFVGVTFVTGFIAGSYPALYLSGFNPARVLKGKLSGSFLELFARKGLVVLQFTISILFIVSVLVVYKQIEFVQNTNLGYNRENVIYFNLSGALNKTENQETMIEEMKKLPGVLSATSTSHNMTGHNSGTSGVVWEGKDPEDHTEFERMVGNYDYIETLDFQIAQGRSFSRAFGTDSSAIIFNQKGIDFMGMKDPIGKTVKVWGEDRHIIGVVKDFHYESLHENYKPVFIILDPSNTYRIMARIAAGKERETLDQIEQLHKKLNPGFAFEYNFLDDTYKAQYASEQRVATLSKYFAGLAILISCLGLFGLAAFTAERRLKEIGIRKVLGSSELNIVYLLSSDFTKIVLIAIAIALPASYYLSRLWLDDFAFKVELKVWYFIASGVLALTIAWLTVGLQTFKAARVNPTECLKNE